MRALQQAKRLFSAGSSSGLAVKAAVARAAKQPFTIENVKLRDIRSDEVLVRIVSTGICHTDLVTKDWGGCAFPIVLGHEGTGVIERVGSAVTDFARGDQIMMSYAACGTCPHCLQGKPPYCYNHGSLNFAGTHPDGSLTHSFPNSSEKLHGSFFQQSSFATHAIASPQNILKVPKFSKLPLHALAPLGCGVQTGAGAVFNTLKASVGSSMAVFGCGAVGLSAIMAAKIAGCAKIVAVDVKPNRLELAKELGATHTVVPTQGNIVEHLKELTNGVGIDYALDTSGNPAAVRSAFESLKALGVCGVIAGAAPGTNIAIETLSLLPGKQLRGVIQGDSVPRLFIPEMLRLHSEGKFPFEKMITYFNGLEEINKAAEAAKDGSAIKPVIKISEP